MQTKLNRMLEGKATDDIQQTLERVYNTETAASHAFKTGKFRGWIERDARNQIRIAVRGA